MGTRGRSSTPDLFSSAPTREAHSQSSESVGSPSAIPPRVLPADLPNAVRQLDDQELDRLVAAALGERARRKRPPLPDAGQKKESTEAVSAHLPQGKLNAVRAAFKAGVKPTRIAKEFGLSRSEVQSALKAMNAQK